MQRHTWSINCQKLITSHISFLDKIHLQSVVMNAAARLIFTSSECDHINPLSGQLHWQKVPRRIDYKLAVLVYKCLHGLAASTITPRCRTSPSSRVGVSKASAFRFVSWAVYAPYGTRLSTYGDRAFPVNAVRICDSLPQHITSAPSLPVFCSRLKTYFSELCYP